MTNLINTNLIKSDSSFH